jgi:hypothetical protein
MHRIIYSEEFDNQARVLGGIGFIEHILRPVIDALARNPRAFRYIETALFRTRYAVTKPSGNAPALLVYFSIDEDEDVIMEWVEIYDPY